MLPGWGGCAQWQQPLAASRELRSAHSARCQSRTSSHSASSEGCHPRRGTAGTRAVPSLQLPAAEPRAACCLAACALQQEPAQQHLAILNAQGLISALNGGPAAEGAVRACRGEMRQGCPQALQPRVQLCAELRALVRLFASFTVQGLPFSRALLGIRLLSLACTTRPAQALLLCHPITAGAAIQGKGPEPHQRSHCCDALPAVCQRWPSLQWSACCR